MITTTTAPIFVFIMLLNIIYSEGSDVCCLFFAFCFIKCILKVCLPIVHIQYCALSKHMGNMCMRLRNAGKGEASPSFFPRFAPNTHISFAVLLACESVDCSTFCMSN